MKTNYFSHRMKCILSLVLLSFVCFAQSAMAVDWGTDILYTRQITEKGVWGKFYCTRRAGGGLTITGIQLYSKPQNGDVIIIPEAFDNDSVYAINRCGEYHSIANNGQNYNYTPLFWENAPDQFTLSVPGSLKELFPLSTTAITGASYAVPNSALTELIIRETNQKNPDLKINPYVSSG